MKAKVIHNYIDNRIRVSLVEKKTAIEIIDFLKERIEKAQVPSPEPTEKGEKFKSYLASFSKKRIGDITFIMSKKNLVQAVTTKRVDADGFKLNIPTGKLLDLIRLKDKLQLFDSDFDL